jgi:hypothetical protein
MFLEKSQKIMDFFVSAALDASFVRLGSGVEKIVLENQQILPGMKLPVIQALTYAIYRHRNFCKTEIFADTLLSYLSEYFGLPDITRQEIIENVLKITSPLVADISKLVCSTDREFLKYLFVQVACADDESELVEDLGLGREILVRMKKSIEIVSAIQDAEADAPLLFLPEMDSQVAEIMNDISKDIENSPWALNARRLLYHVMYVTGPWQESLGVHGIGALFEALVSIATRKLSTSIQITGYLSQKYPEITGSSDILSILEIFGLGFPCGDKNKGGTRWDLTTFGRQVTQEAVAALYLETHRQWDGKSFASLSEEVQASVVKKMSVKDVDFLLNLVKNTRPLAPKALIASLKRLVAMNQPEVASEAALFTLNHDPSPWLRKAACRILATTLRADTVDQVFTVVARSDKSASVRAEAQAALG